MKLYLALFLSCAVTSAGANECATALGGDIHKILQLHDVEPEARLHAAAARVLTEIERGGHATFERECMSRDACHLEELLNAIELNAPHLGVDLALRRTIVRESLRQLSALEDARGDEVMFTLNHLVGRMRSAVGLARLIHALRDASVLALPEIQNALQTVVIDRTEHPIRHVVARTGHARGWGPNYSLADLVRVDLPERDNVHATFDPSGDDPWIQYSYPLMRNLLFELVNNANQATLRRHGQGRAIVRVRTQKDGGARIEIEDFGRAEEYAATVGVGRSFPTRYGVGIGRFRAYLLTKFMGYTIEHRAKADGSGSIVTVGVLPEDLI